MTTETVNVREVAHFAAREPRSSFAAVLRETAQLNDRMSRTAGYVVHELALLDDNVVPSAYSRLREVARIHGTARPKVIYAVTARELAYIDDRISSHRTATWAAREVAHVHGRVVAPPSAKLREVAKIFGRVGGGGATLALILRERALLDDAVYPGSGARLREVAYLDDYVVTRFQPRITLHELARLDDAVAPSVHARALLHEVAYLNDRVTTKSTWRPSLREVVYIDDRAVPPPTGRAYTASILVWGLSTYENYPFLTRADLYAAGANLWRLDATDDYGAPLPAWITTGKVDFGASQGKRPRNLYAAGSVLEPLTVTVTGDVNGQLESFDYTLDLRDQTDYRNNRAALGKGFRSRYLQFKLLAGKYTAMHLLTAEVDVAISPRRIA